MTIRPKCGFCANCRKDDKFTDTVSEEAMDAVMEYLENEYLEDNAPDKKRLNTIKPNKRLPKTDRQGMSGSNINKKVKRTCEEGIYLARYGQPIYGEIVRDEKIEGKRYSDRFIEKSVKMLSKFIIAEEIKDLKLTFIPSSDKMVEDLAKRLAAGLGIEYLDLIKNSSKETPVTRTNKPRNSSHQCMDAMNRYRVDFTADISGNILLVNDLADSGWDFTVCGFSLMEAGAENVYPFAPASMSAKKDR